MSDDFQPGSFEYIEQQLHLLNDHDKGEAFEELCCEFLRHDPVYRNQVKKVWLWNDWPGRWGRDMGIDIIVETHSGERWAVQAKAFRADRTVSKREIDSFLSESSRPEITFRLLIATTNDLGHNARQTLQGQEKPVAFIVRGDLANSEIKWPTELGKLPAKLPRYKPRPHQKTAINSVAKGFRKNDRGQLIMACGTGKTLTSLWINERLKSQRTLVLVPSLSLVSQTLREWSRNCKQPFECLVVCSDETVIEKGADPAVTSTTELGIPVTTDVDEIRSFLNRRSKRPVVVFCTYQSSDRIAEAQEKRTPAFDLVLADEAHRCTGATAGLFATVLDADKIKARRRLFMTATPRFFTKQVLKQAEDRDHELASMDDERQFGSVFHQLNFAEAIEKGLLTDYQVVVIGVTDSEARKLAEEAELVKTEDGATIDARTLAAQIGLAKAIRKYDLKKVITFHSSVSRAVAFSSDTDETSFSSRTAKMPRHIRPTGRLWTNHISGKTPAGKRTTLIKEFAGLPDNKRGLLANCACLGEGVDVPVLDGVAFIAPKRSQVDIIQAVGRVIRKAEDKQVGTIVIPLFIDDSEDADEALSRSAFEPIWRVLCALRAHDETLADQLDKMRLQLGGQERRKAKLRLPDKIHIDLPRNLPANFVEAFHIRAVETTTRRQFLPFEEARRFARSLKLQTRNEWGEFKTSGKMPADIPMKPDSMYKGWSGWGDWLGTGNIANFLKEYRPFKQARKFARSLKLQSGTEWGEFKTSGKLPADIPRKPDLVFKDNGWSSWGDWLGTGNIASFLKEYRPFKQAREFARSLKLKSGAEWREFTKSGAMPDDIPTTLERTYKNKGWNGMGDWLGTGNIAPSLRVFRPFTQARKYVRSLKLNSHMEWLKFTKSGELPADIPADPYGTYKGKGWSGWGNWLGTDAIASRDRVFLPFDQARKFIRSLKLLNNKEWRVFTKSGKLPDDIPVTPERTYKNKGWNGFGDWLGTDAIAPRDRVYRPFEEARTFVHKLKFQNRGEWQQYCKGELLGKPAKPEDIPASPHNIYNGEGWAGVKDWLGK